MSMMSGEPRTGIISKRKAGSYSLSEGPRQASSAGLKRSEGWQPLTNWRAEDRRHQRA